MFYIFFNTINIYLKSQISKYFLLEILIKYVLGHFMLCFGNLPHEYNEIKKI